MLKPSVQPRKSHSGTIKRPPRSALKGYGKCGFKKKKSTLITTIQIRNINISRKTDRFIKLHFLNEYQSEQRLDKNVSYRQEIVCLIPGNSDWEPLAVFSGWETWCFLSSLSIKVKLTSHGHV